MLYFLVQNEEGKPEASLLQSEVFPCVEFRIFSGALLRDCAQTFSIYISVEEKLQHPTKLQIVALLICLYNRGHLTGMGREPSLGPSIQTQQMVLMCGCRRHCDLFGSGHRH